MVTPASQPLFCPCIVTLDSPNADVLRKPTKNVAQEEFHLAAAVGQELLLAIEPLRPAAGLAAPQIGQSLSVFIFSPNRQNYIVAVNPSYEPIGDAKVRGWEACFSTKMTSQGLQMTLVDRYETIQAKYFDLEGKSIVEKISGFAAKVFQHEMDHLLGVLNIDRPEAEIKIFATKEEMDAFLANVRKEDSKTYTNTQAVKSQ